MLEGGPGQLTLRGEKAKQGTGEDRASREGREAVQGQQLPHPSFQVSTGDGARSTALAKPWGQKLQRALCPWKEARESTQHDAALQRCPSSAELLL